MSITKQILHPKGNTSIDIYPKTSADQVEGLPELLADYITQNDLMGVLADYITQNELTTELANYITSSALSTILADYITQSGLATELLNYVTSSDLSSTLANYITSSALSTILASYVTQSGLATELLNYVTNSALATELNKYGKKMTFTKYDVVLTETVNSIEYNLHNINTKFLYLYINTPNAIGENIPHQNIVTDLTYNNNQHFISPSVSLSGGNLCDCIYYKFDCTEPISFQELNSYRYHASGENVFQIKPRKVIINSVNTFKITFSGDGLPSNVEISFYEGVYEQ